VGQPEYSDALMAFGLGEKQRVAVGRATTRAANIRAPAGLVLDHLLPQLFDISK
jgi:hypothetical protein